MTLEIVWCCSQCDLKSASKTDPKYILYMQQKNPWIFYAMRSDLIITEELSGVHCMVVTYSETTTKWNTYYRTRSNFWITQVIVVMRIKTTTCTGIFKVTNSSWSLNIKKKLRHKRYPVIVKYKKTTKTYICRYSSLIKAKPIKGL